MRTRVARKAGSYNSAGAGLAGGPARLGRRGARLPRSPARRAPTTSAGAGLAGGPARLGRRGARRSRARPQDGLLQPPQEPALPAARRSGPTSRRQALPRSPARRAPTTSAGAGLAGDPALQSGVAAPGAPAVAREAGSYNLRRSRPCRRPGAAVRRRGARRCGLASRRQAPAVAREAGSYGCTSVWMACAGMVTWVEAVPT